MEESLISNQEQSKHTDSRSADYFKSEFFCFRLGDLQPCLVHGAKHSPPGHQGAPVCPGPHPPPSVPGPPLIHDIST